MASLVCRIEGGGMCPAGPGTGYRVELCPAGPGTEYRQVAGKIP